MNQQGDGNEQLEADWAQACAQWARNPVVQSNQVGPNYDRTPEHALCLELAKKYPSEMTFFLGKLSDPNPILAAYAMKVLMRIRTPETVIPEAVCARTEMIRMEWRGEILQYSLGEYLTNHKEFDPGVHSADIWDERWQLLRNTKEPEAIFKRGQIVIDKHPRKGVALMRKAMKRGYTGAACFLCDAFTFEEFCPQLSVNPKKALVYHKILAEHGDLESAAHIFGFYFQQKKPNQRSMRFYAKVLGRCDRVSEFAQS